MDAPAHGRVLITPAAAGLLREVIDRHGPVILHQSGGCCDGSAPMCYPRGELLIADRDVLLGTVSAARTHGDEADDAATAVPVWISGPQFAAWRRTQLIIDAVPGRGAGFSLEAPLGMRLLTRSRVLPHEAELDEPLTGADVEAGAVLPEPADPVPPSRLGPLCG